MKKTVNIALQILPKGSNINTYAIVDKAIEVIQRSGIKFEVCPFETVMEGEYDKIMEVIKQAQQACYDNGADETISFIKIQQRKNSDVSIEEKTGKYK